MSKKKDNRYVKNAAKKEAIHKITKALDTKHDVKNTLVETGKNLVVGVIGGGLAGAAIGKPSLLAGLGITGLGHYFDQELITMFGIGVMAANGFQKQNAPGVAGIGSLGLTGMDGIKERLNAYKDNFSEKLFIHIHQLPAKKDNKKGTEGLGAVQFFNYQHDVDQMRKISDELKQELDHLDHIEKQIESSGMEHLHKTGMSVDEAEEQLPPQQQETEENDREQSAEMSDHIL
ncbi:MAG: hypothetical protein ACHQD8_01375 [Chitinophagales bacterium]